MVLATIFWAGAFIAGKMAAASFLPLTLTFLRFLFTLPIIFLLLKMKEPEKLIPEKRQIPPLFVMGVIGTLGYHFFFFLALRYTTAINSSLIGATNPAVTAILAVLFFKEKVIPSRIIGIAISLFGVFCVLTNLDPEIIGNMVFNVGDIYMSLAVLCFSTYMLLSRKYMSKYQISPLTATAYTFLICTVLSGILSIGLENPLPAILQAERRVWLEILYMSIFASVIGYYIQLNSINIIGASKTAMFINLVPVSTILLAVLILKEQLSYLKIISALIIIGGVYLASRPEKDFQAK
ncbi:MAG: DMT family transporter [Peptococcaceae bacterium]|nr:DMT family transporter [Peptococcaceae bacterium]